MKSAFLKLLCVFLLAPIEVRAVNPTLQIEVADKKRGFSRIRTTNDKHFGLTEVSVLVDVKTFFLRSTHRGAYGAPQEFAVSLAPVDPATFRGVTAPLGKFSPADSAFKIWFRVPTEELSRYQLEFQGFTAAGDGGIRFGNGSYTLHLETLRGSKEAINGPSIQKDESVTEPVRAR